MTPSRARFVTACQQLLALAVVAAVLTPAAGVVTLDVVGTGPGERGSHGALAHPTARTAAYASAALQPSRVPEAPVRAHVREVALTAPHVTSGRALASAQARVVTRPSGLTRLTSRPQVVTGYGEVGVTWAHGSAAIPERGTTFSARTRTGHVWSRWTTIPYDPEHGPDPHSAEARHARPGTDPLLIGRVDDVQVRAVTRAPLPSDLKLAVVAPGHARRTAVQRPAYDTATLPGGDAADSVYRTGEPTTGDSADGSADSWASLAAAVFTPEPVIYSRAQWGADEQIRGASSLHYGEVHAGFVHHTVNANNYSRADVPGLLRSIYAYHVKSRGWSDIGYNYLIDRFGRIWEGRYGGIDRPVVGAHTLNYNDDAFAASAIGNYQVTQPSEATIQAYGVLFAWKLSLHGVTASSTKQYVTSRYFEAINGHRDAASTLCPGQYLYARIPDIRRLAAAAQQGWSGRQLESDLAGSPHPDIVVRRASDGEAFVITTGGMIHFADPAAVTAGVTGATGLAVSPDLTGDDRPDLVVRQSDGKVTLRAGSPGGGFGAPTTIGKLRGTDQISAPGDLNGDRRGDLVARNPVNGRLLLLLGHHGGGFRKVALGKFWGSFDTIAAAGDATGDGHPDLVARTSAGALWLYAGKGKAGFGHGTQVPGDFSGYDAITGGGDYSGDGIPDLVLRDRSGAGWVLPGSGDGTYGQLLGPVGSFAGSPVLAGGNAAGSGAADVVGISGDDVVVWASAGTFDLGAPIDTGANFTGVDKILRAGDWDRDGHGDVITRDHATGGLTLWHGDGQGHLGTPTPLATGFAEVTKLAAVGDMTGDGYPDLMAQPRHSSMRIYPGTGTGLAASYPAYGQIKGATQIGVGRWNGDGAPDSLVRSGTTLTLYQGNGPGGLYGPTRLPADLSPYDWVIGVSGLRLGGHPDLLVRKRGTGQLFALRGTAKSIKAPVLLGDGLAGFDLAG